MKIIDEKGKLFGLINAVDLLVLVAVLLVLGAAVYKIKGKDDAQNTPKTVRVTVLAPAIRPEMLTNVQVGDKMVTGSNFTNVEIKDFEIKPAYMVISNSEDSGRGHRSLPKGRYFYPGGDNDYLIRHHQSGWAGHPKQ